MARYADEAAIAHSQRAFYTLSPGAQLPFSDEVINLVDEHTTAGASAVMIFLRDPRRGWLFLRRLDIPPAPSPGRPGEQPEGLSVS